LEKRFIVCDHCDALESVLTDIVGDKVTRVLMKRVANELHGQVGSSFQILAPQATVQPATSKVLGRPMFEA
jgi:hypothetical protein